MNNQTSLERKLLDERLAWIKRGAEEETAIATYQSIKAELIQTEPDTIAGECNANCADNGFPPPALGSPTGARSPPLEPSEKPTSPKVWRKPESPSAAGSFLTSQFSMDFDYFAVDGKVSGAGNSDSQQHATAQSPSRTDASGATDSDGSMLASPDRNRLSVSVTGRRVATPQEEILRISNERLAKLKTRIQLEAGRSSDGVWRELFTSALAANCTMRAKANSYTELIDHLALEKLQRFEREFDELALREQTAVNGASGKSGKSGKSSKDKDNDKRRKSKVVEPEPRPPGLSTQSVLLQATSSPAARGTGAASTLRR